MAGKISLGRNQISQRRRCGGGRRDWEVANGKSRGGGGGLSTILISLDWEIWLFSVFGIMVMTKRIHTGNFGWSLCLGYWFLQKFGLLNERFV